MHVQESVALICAPPSVGGNPRISSTALSFKKTLCLGRHGQQLIQWLEEMRQAGYFEVVPHMICGMGHARHSERCVINWDEEFNCVQIGQQSFDLPDRHFRVCITTAAEVMKFDVYTHREVLVGVKGPNGNIVSIQLPSLPLEYPVGPNHSLYCPKLINRLLPDRFTNRNCAYLVPHRAPPAAPTMGVEPDFSESTDTSQVMQHADKRSRST